MTENQKTQTENSHDISQVLHDYLSQLEDESQDTLNSLLAIQDLLHKHLQAEATRLINKFGEDDPRVKKLQAHLNSARGLKRARATSVELELVRIKTPEVEEEDGLIHGRMGFTCKKVELTAFEEVVQDTRVVKGKIVDKEDKEGVPGLLVTAYDKDLRFEDLLGAAMTDPNGEFKISYQTKDFQQDPDPADEMYSVDRTAGEVTFGDGKTGQRPPSGLTNIQATYRYGSGEYSNVMITTRELDDKPVRFLIFFPD
jgi:hypothetical protein